MDQTADISQSLIAITNLEEQLTKLLGPAIWNFSRVLAPDVNQNSAEMTALTPQAESLVLEYIKTANNVLDAFTIAPIEIDEDSGKSHTQMISDAFNEVSYIIYSLRYAKALESFADYQFLRTRTWLENKLLAAGKLKDHPDNNITYCIYLPGVIVTKKNGTIDQQATITQEQKTDEIKCYFSTFTAADHYKNILFNEIYDKSSYGMIPRLYEKEILDLCKQALHTILYYPVHMVYEYLSRGYNTIQAQNNASHYIEDVLKKQNYQLSPDFLETEKVIDEIIKKGLDNIPQLEKETKEVFAQEFKQQTILQLYYGSIYPNNYYQLDVRKPLKINPEEAEFPYLVDFYLYNDQKLNTDFPFETYALILTPEAKQNIFQAVSNGQNNPNFTINDYLNYRPVNKLRDL